MRTLEDIGPIVEHIYIVSVINKDVKLLVCKFVSLITFQINNLGPFSIDYFKMKFYWPYELASTDSDENTVHGKYLLYLTETPRVS